MKRTLLPLIATGLVVMAIPLEALGRHRDHCRLDHPAYYYTSHGKRAHGRYGVGHYRSYHRRYRAPRRRARVCRIDHPGFYYRSYGRQLHGRYGVAHFRSYHRDRYSGYGHGPRYRYRRGYYPGTSFSLHFGGRRYGKRPRIGFHIDF